MNDAQVFEGKLTKRLITELKNAGLEVSINIDLSRNVYLKLRYGEHEISQSRAPNAAILQLVVSAGACTYETFATLKTGWLNRRMAQFMQVLNAAGGLAAMQKQAIVIEAPFFEASIVNFRNPPLALCNALSAAAAPTADAFMALPHHIRSALGIYRRESAQRFTRIGAPLDPAPVVLL